MESDGSTFPSKRLTKLSSWDHNYFVTNLISRDGRIFLGDAISSVSILELSDATLKTIARDYGPLYPVAIESTGTDGVIGADVSFQDAFLSVLRS
jgi:DNA damage-binding protein 1